MPSEAIQLEAALQPTPLPAQRRILIVDDDQDLAELLARGFRRFGYRADVALTARAGLQMARQNRPDAVLLDIRLPDECGLDVCQRLTDDQRTWDIPVIMVSGECTPDVVRSARQAGCRFFLGKPYDPNALLVLVESAIEQNRW